MAVMKYVFFASFAFQVLVWLVGIVWLTFLGEWKTLGIGLIIVMFGHYIVSIFIFISLIVTAPLLILANKIKIPALQLPIFIIVSCVDQVVLIFWYYIAMCVIMNVYESREILPLMLYAFIVVLVPVFYLSRNDFSQEDENGTNSSVTLLCYWIGFIVNIICMGYFRFSLYDSIFPLTGVMIIGVIFNAVIQLKMPSHRS